MKRQPTPQHITWFLDMFRNNQLDLDPPYQRKSVWTSKDRRFFLDTIFRNYPTPPIFVHREINDSGHTTFHVVDGKQRLETIINFSLNKISIDKEFGDINLNGKKFSDLTPEYKRKFWDYVLVVDFIESIEGTNINDVFDRVNRNSKNLQPQELRHARFDGWFIHEVENESENTFWSDIKVTTKAKEKRMKNVQFVSELLLVILEKQIVGFSQDYLDEMYAKYDLLEEVENTIDVEEYQAKKERLKTLLSDMDSFNQCISNYCKTANNLYTLWGLLSLKEDSIPVANVIAERYASFMQGVQFFIDAQTTEETVPEAGQAEHFKYYINSKGAATEAPQRIARLHALNTILNQ